MLVYHGSGVIVEEPRCGVLPALLGAFVLTPLDGVVSSRPFRAPLLATRSVPLGLKSSRLFSSAAHFLTLERGAMETSTPLDAVLSQFPTACRSD